MREAGRQGKEPKLSKSVAPGGLSSARSHGKLESTTKVGLLITGDPVFCALSFQSLAGEL